MAKLYTDEWKRKISESKKGQVAWNKGLTKLDERVAKYADKLKNKKFSVEHRENLSNAMKGRTPWNLGKTYKSPNISKALKGKINLKNRGENNIAWKGDNVTYKTLHSWLRRRYGIPMKCEKCGIENNRIEWSNKTGNYKRARENWEHLCKLCHRRKDGNQYTKNI